MLILFRRRISCCASFTISPNPTWAWYKPAGIWRRQAIEEAGGWEHDTLTEDTDLSYRAQLKGWKFVYRQDVECPAELPVEMTAFKTQQARWAKGLIQTAKKI